jgi:hypothetical protein
VLIADAGERIPFGGHQFDQSASRSTLVNQTLVAINKKPG